MGVINCTYYINGEPVLLQDTHQDLGIIMSSDLSWNTHYRHILSSAYKTLSLLWRIFSTTEQKNTLFVSSQIILNLCITFQFGNRNIRVIEQIQRRATKYILYDNTSDVHNSYTFICVNGSDNHLTCVIWHTTPKAQCFDPCCLLST